MTKRYLNASMDRRTAAALKLIARNEYDGNVSLALRLIVRKAAGERNLWPLSDAQMAEAEAQP